MVVVDLRQPGRTLDLVLRVNVERLDQSLLPELAPELHRSVQFSKFDPRDLHRVFLVSKGGNLDNCRRMSPGRSRSKDGRSASSALSEDTTGRALGQTRISFRRPARVHLSGEWRTAGFESSVVFPRCPGDPIRIVLDSAVDIYCH